MEERETGKVVFAIVISVALIFVGLLSYAYLKGGQEAYPGDTGDEAPPPTSADLAPDFTYTAVNGGVVSLSGMRGKVVVLDFMATWCQPCKDQIINLKPINTEYSGRGVVVVSVNVDLQVTNQELLDYRNQLGANWDFVTDSDGVSMNPKYSVRSIPTIVIIGPDGQIANRNVGLMSAADLRNAIDSLL